MSELFQFSRDQRPADPRYNAAQYVVELIVVVGLIIALPGLAVALCACVWWSWICGDL